jgi:transcriptional regulator with XRE-family HTH domain
LRQADFAAKLGYEQSYISAIELGTKGPPSVEFIERLTERLQLDEQWTRRLMSALDESQRKITLPSESSGEMYKMFNALRRQIDALHPAQVELIQMALQMPTMLTTSSAKPTRMPRRTFEPSDSTDE